MRRNSATARRSSQPRFRLFHLSQALIIILIECIFVVAENERSNEIFPFLAKAFWISVHTAEEFSRSQLSSVPLSLSLFLSLSLTFYLSYLSLSLSIPRSAISSFRVYYAYPRFVSDPPRSTFTPRACPLLFPALFSRVAEAKLHPSPRKEPTSFPSHSIQQFGSA